MLQIKKLFKRKDAPVSVHDTTPPPPSILALAEKIAKKKCQSRTAQDMVPSHLHESLRIECPDPTAEDKLRDDNQQLGQRLVRQENWKDLTQAIQNADAANTLTPGFISVAELIAYGARADVVLAAEHVISEIETGVAKELLNGIEEFEHILAENPDNYVIACIVAQTHIDMGWAWRGTAWAEEIPLRNLEAYNAHFDRAYDIIAPFIDRFPTSPLVVATHCAQVTGAGGKTHKIADQYERLIDLNPHNPRPMRAMGTHLLPRWFGSYDQLELEARRTAARTENIWGAGGYTWVQFDAISNDDVACANLDLPFFIDGLRDILTRCPTPHTANLLAAYCANTIGQGVSGNEQADHIRRQIADCTEWIVREHITELHPMIWAHAAHGFDNNLHIRSPQKFAASGRDDAMRIMANLFKSEIAAGNSIVFTAEGPRAIAT